MLASIKCPRLEDRVSPSTSALAFRDAVYAVYTHAPLAARSTQRAADDLEKVSQMSLGRYVTASALGLVPTQVINVYLGTTVRSMEEVLDDDATAATGYAVLLAQVVLSVVLMSLIVRKARQELRDTVLSSGCSSRASLDTAFCPHFPWVPVAPMQTAWTRPLV
ncbi:hypothetical protein HPB50_002904 [Hyalomma asiaticum]|uniref:Uncharacterized protein n=1 Tax=Hyalomma asiaticum TaxID=266040 RepID=A0ACB7TG84_HYAAI|nr:hypothetical protein HPB50_002904 [Hyalomma asiaticum]